MALYGVDAWCERGEAFRVYFSLFSRISRWDARGRDRALRKPLSGLANYEPLPGTVPLLAVMIGSVTYDGGAEGRAGTHLARPAGVLPVARAQPRARARASFMVGLLGACCSSTASIGWGSSGRGAWAAASAHAAWQTSSRLAGADRVRLRRRALLDPAALPGPGALCLVSNPLGRPARTSSGRSTRQIDYAVIGANGAWYWQVGFVVAGHVAALMLAHERALALYEDAARPCAPSTGCSLVMVGFTLLALWLLARRTGGGVFEIAHAGHWLVNVAYVAPVVVFLGWLGVTTWRERRREDR